MYRKSFDAGIIKLYGNDGRGSGTYIPLVCPVLSASRSPQQGAKEMEFTEPMEQLKMHRASKAGHTVGGVVHVEVGEEFPERFGRCALVGSSAAMRSKGHGADIDRHDTVVRVNRLPAPEFASDFGTRTDVLFAGPVSDKRPVYTKLGFWYRLFGGDMRLCFFKPRRGGRCPFKTLILKGSDFPEYGQAWAERYPVEQPGWRPRASVFPVAYQTDEVNSFAYRLMGGSRPTNGFQAFVLFALMCESLSVYGFSGSGTADNHKFSKKHNLSTEHEFYARIISGQRLSFPVAEGMPADPSADKLMERLHDQSSHVKMVVDEMNCSSDFAVRTFVDLMKPSQAGENPLWPVKQIDSCAIVAPTVPLQAKGKGPQIDAHQWVLRLNRIPTAHFYRDFGARTDVLFLNCLRFRTGTVEHMGPPPHRCSNKYTCWKVSDLFACENRTQAGCNLSSVIIRPGCRDAARRKELWSKAFFPVGMQLFDLEATLQDMLQVKAVSTGLLATFTAASICKSVTLYGFVGTHGLHWHTMESDYNLTVEHEFLTKLAAREPVVWKANASVTPCMVGAIKNSNIILDGYKL